MCIRDSNMTEVKFTLDSDFILPFSMCISKFCTYVIPPVCFCSSLYAEKRTQNEGKKFILFVYAALIRCNSCNFYSFSIDMIHTLLSKRYIVNLCFVYLSKLNHAV